MLKGGFLEKLVLVQADIKKNMVVLELNIHIIQQIVKIVLVFTIATVLRMERNVIWRNILKEIFLKKQLNVNKKQNN